MFHMDGIQSAVLHINLRKGRRVCMGGNDGRVVQLKLDIARAEATAKISELIKLSRAS